MLKLDRNFDSEYRKALLASIYDSLTYPLIIATRDDAKGLITFKTLYVVAM